MGASPSLFPYPTCPLEFAFCAVSTVLTQLSELTSSTPRNPSSPEQAMAFLCVTPKWQEELLFVGWDTQLKGESAYIAG